jgi:hypothetical protein
VLTDDYGFEQAVEYSNPIAGVPLYAGKPSTRAEHLFLSGSPVQESA